jgi:sugar lactone lactonase YvrE
LVAITLVAVSMVNTYAASPRPNAANSSNAADEGVIASDRRLATGLANNLVEGMPVTLSQRYSGIRLGKTVFGDGYKLADGDRGTSFFLGSGCAETTDMPDPWARVDFGREVPIAAVNIYTRTDTFDTGLGFVEVYVGSNPHHWFENFLCAKGVTLSRAVQPTTAACLYAGRYLFIVLRTRGAFAKRLSLCEVEATPRGPEGTPHILRTAGVMWNLKLEGLALDRSDRVRIVANTMLCGEKFTTTMHPSVLELTSPKGERSEGDYYEEVWHNIQINRMGLYKVCWCGNLEEQVGGCTLDQHFFMHVATIVINGIVKTISGGDGDKPQNYGDVTNFEFNDPRMAKLDEPYGIAATADRIYFSERSGHRIRYLQLSTGRLVTLVGRWLSGTTGDDGMAKNALLSTPAGICLTKDEKILFIADSGSHRVRQVEVHGDRPEEGTITTVAGNGFPGFSGDGGKAIEAQLNSPGCVHVDTNELLWICDTRNNRVRVVSLGDRLYLVPGTNEYRSKIILTSIGDGIIGTKGDGGLSTLAQVGAPSAIAVSSGFLNSDEGSLPSFALIAEQKTHVIRQIALEYKSYFGVVTTMSGSGEAVAGSIVGSTNSSEFEAGYMLEESMPLRAPEALLESPEGMTIDEGMLYVSDTQNNRLLMYPLVEYMSVGCWRENHKVPWVPLIEGEQNALEFLDSPEGNPELREAAIRKCALAALKLGFPGFAVRQWGYCAADAQILLNYKREGSSTSCANGLGGARDNSVYKFSQTGYQVQEREIVYVLSGRQHLGITGNPRYAGDDVPAWDGEMKAPAGIAINPATKDIWFADSGNNRLRMIFYQIGPNRFHEIRCINGRPCIVGLEGNGLRPANGLAVVPMKYGCGEANSTFEPDFRTGLARNPVSEIPSPSFTKKEYHLGTITASYAGTYRLCYCTFGATIFGVPADCATPMTYIMDAGVLEVDGPDMKNHYVTRAGVPFDLAIYGRMFLHQDRIRLVGADVTCGTPGAETTSVLVKDSSAVDSSRLLGNTTAAIWGPITILATGRFHVCWCPGLLGSTVGHMCATGADFNVDAASIDSLGPEFSSGVREFPMSIGASLTLTGRGLDAGDRIRIVNLDQNCGTERALFFSQAVESHNGYPHGKPDRFNSESETWENVKIRLTNRILRVCWCGARNGCTKGEDFNIVAAHIIGIGPVTQPFTKVAEMQNPNNPGSATDLFSLNFTGTGFTSRERIKIVDSYTQCGTTFANRSSPDLNVSEPVEPDSWGKLPSGIWHLNWDNIRLLRVGIYRVCYCGCLLPGSVLTPCCEKEKITIWK